MSPLTRLARRTLPIALLAALSTAALAQTEQPVPAAALASVPDLQQLVARPRSELADVVQRFSADLNSLDRRYDADGSPAQRERMRDFYAAWRERLHALRYDRLGREGKVDYLLLDNYLSHELVLLDREAKQRAEMVALVPFADSLLALQDARRDLRSVDGRAAAHVLAEASRVADSLRALFEPQPRQAAPRGEATLAGAPADSTARPDTTKPRAVAPRVSRTVANRAAERLDAIRGVVGNWYKYYDGYDPLFSWWAKDPYRKLDESLGRYARTLRERVVGFKANEGPQYFPPGAPRPANASLNPNDGPIVGDPIGREGLMQDLRYEMISYTPEELIEIARREYAFSLAQMKAASRQMGFGDDWHAALEKVKNSYVDPGKQPELIRDLARQAEEYFAAHDWVTIPPLAREDWRMEMMSPERQRVAPFFLGGDLILVSYPTADMSDEDKLMSLRGNNPHFSHATVFHELNPGHHLQGFMTARYNAHRRLFGTPFWNEGQSLYWEMFLWDHGFDKTPEDRVGALFWRMHRSARIIFSLSFHLGKMTPEQAVQFLVDSVGFERANAEGEVRRSFNGSYPPLYQIGYMIGGLQLRALHHELVDSKKMSEREFHDAVLEGGPMPIAMVRARLGGMALPEGGLPAWRFGDELPAPVDWSK